MRLGACLLFVLLSWNLTAQITPVVPSDSTKMQKAWHLSHSPLKATTLALVLPGAGQAYNKKYWKMPIVYAGLGTCVYFIQTNTTQYRFWKGAYIALNDTDPNTNPTGDAVGLSSTQLKSNTVLMKKYLDVSYMSLLGVYVLQAIDANVDAHLFYFDVSPNLSLHWTPAVSPKFTGLQLNFNFHP
jgi:Family of unknown function (DUF5683)